jgi:N-acetylglucosaminyl-diphospho-decaprenol L-rhamnosyltransferase
MKLSIIILCWNDLKVISDCLRSIYATTLKTEFEIIVSDNGSTDGSIEHIRQNFPQVRLIENGRNLRFAKGNNVGIEASVGEYVLILNPDTIMHEGTLDDMVAYADGHPKAGAFGCKILSPDGSNQGGIRPLPSIRSEWCLALGLRPLARISDFFHPGEYEGWKGDTERTVGWIAGCFILIRGELLKRLGGFDAQFFYYYEDTDLCRRVWEAGHTILYNPKCSFIHLGGQSTVNRFTPVSFALDAAVTRYLYYYKCFGMKGIQSCRRAFLVSAMIRRMGFGLLQMVRPSEVTRKKLELLRALFEWNYRIDLKRLVEKGEEPEIAFKPADRISER